MHDRQVHAAPALAQLLAIEEEAVLCNCLHS